MALAVGVAATLAMSAGSASAGAVELERQGPRGAFAALRHEHPLEKSSARWPSASWCSRGSSRLVFSSAG